MVIAPRAVALEPTIEARSGVPIQVLFNQGVADTERYYGININFLQLDYNFCDIVVTLRTILQYLV